MSRALNIISHYEKTGEVLTSWKEEVENIKQCPQRQDSSTNQMVDLQSVANKLGFYDAADYIRREFIEKKRGNLNG